VVTGFIQAVDIFESTQSADRPYREGPMTPEETITLVKERAAVQPFYGAKSHQLVSVLKAFS
jgi:hypothetical protein